MQHIPIWSLMLVLDGEDVQHLVDDYILYEKHEVYLPKLVVYT
jgi:hypothetical protein